MPFILKDETAGVNVIYIDDSGNLGIMGSANAGQMLSFAGLGLVTSSSYVSNGVATPGTASPLAGTIVIPVSAGQGTVSYSLAQTPSVTSDPAPSSVSNSSTVWQNTTGSDITVNYNIW